MHRRTGADLLPLDTEIKKTLRNLKKEIAVAETLTMAKQRETNHNLPVAIERPQ